MLEVWGEGQKTIRTRLSSPRESRLLRLERGRDAGAKAKDKWSAREVARVRDICEARIPKTKEAFQVAPAHLIVGMQLGR
jgi:hypothetical protein